MIPRPLSAKRIESDRLWNSIHPVRRRLRWVASLTPPAVVVIGSPLLVPFPWSVPVLVVGLLVSVGTGAWLAELVHPDGEFRSCSRCRFKERDGLLDGSGLCHACAGAS